MNNEIWDKYTKIKEIKLNNNSLIKTYLSNKEFIIKEIHPKDWEDYNKFLDFLEYIEISEEIKFYDLIEEKEKIFVVIDNNEKTQAKFDSLISNKDSVGRMQGITEGHCNPISISELNNLLKKQTSMCKIIIKEIKNDKEIIKKGSGFFCQILKDSFPIKYALFTNNHVLNEYLLEEGKTINFEYNKKNWIGTSYNIINKEIKITDKRKVFTNKTLDYTFIEIFESDGIKDFFTLDEKIFSKNKKKLKNEDIFILQYPKGGELSFSSGKILLINDRYIRHNASTLKGSSGSPIIRRFGNNIIGLHYRRFSDKKEEKEINEESCKYNIATPFDAIISHINFLYSYTTINYFLLGYYPIIRNIIYLINDNFKNTFFLNEIKYKVVLDQDTDISKRPTICIEFYDCFFFVYDVSERYSFDNVIKILKEPQKRKNDFFINILFGNIPFYDFERKVSFDEGKKLAEKNNMLFFEIDYRKKDDLKHIFEKTIEKIADYRIKKYLLNTQK